MIVESARILDYRLIALLPDIRQDALDGLFDLWPDTGGTLPQHL